VPDRVLACGLGRVSRQNRAWGVLVCWNDIAAVTEHANNTGYNSLWDKVKLIDRDPHWYTRRVKEVIHIRLHPKNINRDSGIEILEAWMPRRKKPNSRRPIRKQTAERTVHRNCTNHSYCKQAITAEHLHHKVTTS